MVMGAGTVWVRSHPDSAYRCCGQLFASMMILVCRLMVVIGLCIGAKKKWHKK